MHRVVTASPLSRAFWVLILTISSWSFLSLAFAEDCMEPVDLNPWLGSICLGEDIRDLTAHGDFVFSIVDYRVLALDASNPLNPEELSSTTISQGVPSGLHADENWLLVATRYENGLSLMKRLPDGTVQPKSWIPTSGLVRSMVVFDSALYIAVDQVGVLIFDISDPQNPELVNNILTDSFRLYIGAQIGHYLYIGVLISPEHSFQTWDISNPFQPVVTQSLAPLWAIEHFIMVGDVGYAMDEGNYIHSFDMEDPAHPHLLDSIHSDFSGGYVSGFMFQGNRLAVKNNQYLNFIDIEDPYNLAILDIFMEVPRSRHFQRVGDTVYFPRWDGCIDIRSFHSPFSSVTSCLGLNHGSIGIDRKGDLLYVGGDHFTIINLEDPDSPTFLGQVVLPSANHKGVITDEAAYILDGENGFHVVDIRDPSEPAYVTTINSPGGWLLRDIAVGSHYLSVVGYHNRLTVFDISDPLSPVHRLHMVYNYHDGYRVAAKDDCVYVSLYSGSAGGVTMAYRIPETGNLITLGQIQPEDANYMKVYGDYLFSQDHGGLQIFDISDPQQPVFLANHLGIPGSISGYDGSYLYTKDYPGPTHVIDFQDPFYPADLGLLQIPATGPSFFATSWKNRLIMVTTNWVLVSTPMCSGTVDVFLHGFEIQVDESRHRASWQISEDLPSSAFNLLALTKTHSVDVPVQKSGVGWYTATHQPAYPDEILGYDLYLEVNGQMSLLEHHTLTSGNTPGSPTPLSVQPNPFNPQTMISFDIEYSQRIRIEVFDLLGRRLARLANEEYEPGHHQLSWDGTDTAHRDLPTGVYFLRLVSDQGVRTQKVSLIR